MKKVFLLPHVTLEIFVISETQKKKNEQNIKFLGYFALKCDVYSCAVTVGTEKNISVNFISFQVFVHVNETKSCENVVMK